MKKKEQRRDSSATGFGQFQIGDKVKVVKLIDDAPLQSWIGQICEVTDIRDMKDAIGLRKLDSGIVYYFDSSELVKIEPQGSSDQTKH